MKDEKETPEFNFIVYYAALHGFDKQKTEESLARDMGVAKLSIELPWERFRETFERMKLDPKWRQDLIDNGLMRP